MAGDGLMGLLRTLNRDEILEVLTGGEGFCQHCQSLLQTRIRNLIPRKFNEPSESNENSKSSAQMLSAKCSTLSLSEMSAETYTKNTSRGSGEAPKDVHSGGRARNSTKSVYASPASVNSKHLPVHLADHEASSSLAANELSEEQIDHVRFAQIGRKKDYSHIERINGKAKNVLQGLELHTGVFNAEEQEKIVECVYGLQRKGQSGQLRARTYTEPHKWMRGKGRVTIQFGCCYNYALDKKGNPPGIVRDEEVDPLPPLFNQMIKRLVRWHVLPASCVPDSCIVNIYDEGDCIPPHIDNHDFLRPFCTVSFLAECNILFGTSLKVVGPGEFSGPVSIPLPVGSVLVLNGNGADIAKHCVPGVPARRISITFRKMDVSKRPYNYSPSLDPELIGIKPLGNPPLSTKKLPIQQIQSENKTTKKDAEPPAEGTTVKVKGNTSKLFNNDNDFPPLGSSVKPGTRHRGNRDIV